MIKTLRFRLTGFRRGVNLSKSINKKIKRINQKLKSFWLKIKTNINKEKLIAISLLSRILGLVLVMALSPIQVIHADESEENQPIVFQSEMKLDKNNPNLLVIEQNKITISVGESNYQKTIREEKERQSVLTRSTRKVIARERVTTEIEVSLSQKRELVKRAASQYNIDWKILEAVWQVESGKKWVTSVKSYAGAQGPMQFMRGTWNRYAVDGNGDGIADINDAQDAVYAGANLLAQAGADSGNIDQALLSYNHAQWYVNKVKAVANSIQE